MGKQKPKPSQPYQGPQFGAQQQLLSDTVLGNMMGQQQMNNRIAAGGMPVWNQGNSYAGGGGNFYSPSSAQYGNTGIVPASKMPPGNTGIVPPGVAGNPPQPTLQGGGGFRGSSPADRAAQARADNYQQLSQIQPNAPLGFQYAGAPIAGQMGSNTTVGGMPQATTGNGMRYSSYRFQDPGANFTQRNQYQFQQTPSVNVQDIYTPQYQMALRDITEQGKKSNEQLLSDMNARGMLTTGATTKQFQLQQQERDRQLADLSARYSIAQGQSQLAEDQMRRQMEQQRQLSQAEEIFRQQGATDEQAKFLASQNVNLQGMQAGHNLSAFGQNLAAQQQQYGQGLSNANLLMQQQGQQFNQALQGRQQATAEEQLANLFRRQPLEDLMKMWQQQTGQIGATEGSSPVMDILGPLIGAGATLGAKFI